MPTAQERRLTVTRSARYFQAGALSENTRHLWVVCHGYGQLGAYFIRHFTALTDADPTLVVIAPEGLSRFYLEGTSGRIGASWMTREDRTAEIADYVSYLNQLAETVLVECATDVRITILGFSQGAATVSRWLAHASFRPYRLVLWAGAFPPDVDFTVASHLAQRVPITLVCGTQDEFISATDLQTQQVFLQKLGANPEIIPFEGKHELNAAVLRQLHTSG
ncbi:alpha/beta hydrolase [Hymenobacter sp. BT730]|uniref:alpha/beta hydrolase n=1 Tax=Hymenobacter sp. BT730 TaxID=3063332 RepID=UPI0026DFE3CB|nr:phospholipase [Hymenobacter sp. BT730]